MADGPARRSEYRKRSTLGENPSRILLKSDYELLKTGESTLNDVKELKLSAAKSILPEGFRTVREICSSRSASPPISTGCSGIDRVLGGGLRRRCITEIYGESGCGKTQIGLQIAAIARESGAVYLCTEDAFPSKRLQQLFVANRTGNEDVSRYGEKIFILQIPEVDDLMKCAAVRLPLLLEMHKSISIIILDSITAPFRGNYHEDNAAINRAQHIKQIGMNLLKCAKDFDVAVLCINQVSADFDRASSNGVIPCLGLVWSNLVTTRILVCKTNRQINKLTIKGTTVCGVWHVRNLQVMYSPNLPTNSSIYYVITSDGVRGLE